MYIWDVKLFNFPEDSDLAKDLKKHKEDVSCFYLSLFFQQNHFHTNVQHVTVRQVANTIPTNISMGPSFHSSC